MPIQNNDQILAAAIEGLEAKKDAIDIQITRLRQMMPGESSNDATAESTRGRRTMSPSARKRIAAAQRARWAALEGPVIPRLRLPTRRKGSGGASVPKDAAGSSKRRRSVGRRFGRRRRRRRSEVGGASIFRGRSG